MLQRTDPPGSNEVWRRSSGEEGEGDSRGRPSSSPGEAAFRPEAAEEGPATGRWPAAITGITTTPDPVSPEAGEAAGDGAMELQGGRTGAGGGPGERPVP